MNRLLRFRISLAAGMVACAVTLPKVLYAQSAAPDFPAANNIVRALTLSGNRLYVGGEFSQLGSPSGGGVPVDSASGLPLSGYTKIAGAVSAVVPDGVGGWFLAGNFAVNGATARPRIAHLLAGGGFADWSPAFGGGSASALALHAGILYAGGQFSSVDGQTRFNLASWNAASGALRAWSPTTDDGVLCLACQGDVVYVGGRFSAVNGQLRRFVVALDSTGVVLAWNASLGAVTTGEVDAIAPGNGVVYLGGGFTSAGVHARASIAAVDAVSGAVTPWNPGSSTSTTTGVRELALSGSTIYVAGFFDHMGGAVRHSLAAIDTSGTLLPWYPQVGVFFPTGLVADGGSIYISGYFAAVNAQPRQGVAAVDPATGALQPWNPHPDSPPSALAVSPGVVYLAGQFATLQGVVRNGAAAIDLSDDSITSWNPNLSDWVMAMTTAAGKVFLGGFITGVGGQMVNHLAAVDSATAAPVGPDVSTNSVVNALAAGGSFVFVGGEFWIIAGQTRWYLASIDATTQHVTDWLPNPDGEVRALAVDGGTLYVGGDFSNIAGASRSHLAAFDIASGALLPWSAGAFADSGATTVLALAVSNGRVFVGGTFHSIGGVTRHNLAAFDATSGALLAWDPEVDVTDPGLDPAVNALSIGEGVVYAGGFFNTAHGVDRNYAASFDTSLGIPNAWDPEPGFGVYALASRSPLVFAGGQFLSVGAAANAGLAAIGDITTGVTVALVRTDVRPGGVTLDWYATGSVADAQVSRRTAGQPWQIIGQVATSGTGRMEFTDTNVNEGERYGYRLEWNDEEGRHLGAEVEIEVPMRDVLSFEGAQPNPTGGPLTIAWSVPDPGATFLEVFDVTGRRVLSRNLDDLRSGRHVAVLGRAGAFRPGLYLLRLRHGRIALTKHALVLR